MSNKDKFQSNEELHFSWYLDELKAKGYIDEWKKNEQSFELTKGLSLKYVVPMKKVANKTKEQTILHPSIYTHDFSIYWNKKAIGLFITDIDVVSDNKLTTPFISHGLISYIETKAEFDRGNMTRLAINNIKFVYEKFHIYINIIKVPKIFEKTFTPDRYLMTDKTFKPRTIRYKNVKTIREFIKSIQK